MTCRIPHALPLPVPAEMAAWDRAAIHEFGLRQDVLMENAGRAGAEVALDALGDAPGLRALVLAGGGNNGGDAFVAARHLADAGARVLVLHTTPARRYRGAAAANLRLARRMGLPVACLGARDLEAVALAHFEGTPDLIVDGLLGTGFSGTLRPEAQGWVQAVNRLGRAAFVLALDIPSGLDGATGRPCPVAVMADATVCFQAAKLGTALPEAGPWTGELHIEPIGIPGFLMRRAPADCALLTSGTALLAPQPDPLLHKGRAGHVLVVGGSRGLTGAPLLAALGALRGGAGLATVACPGALAAEVRAGCPDVMTLPLGPGDAWSAALAAGLAPALARFDALALGPGLGREPGALAFLEALLELPLPPVLADADALYWLARRPELARRCAALTPHPGEAARLAGTDTAAIQADRPGAARALAGHLGAVVALKGAGTVVAAPGGAAWLAPFAVPALAVAGSGDVLAGLTASLLARGLPAAEAACLGVYWHGLAGEAVQARAPLRGALASEIAAALPRALLSAFEDFPQSTPTTPRPEDDPDA